MPVSITAVVENDAIKLPPGVHMPDGTKVEISVREELPAKSKSDGTLSWMLEYAGMIEGPETSPPSTTTTFTELQSAAGSETRFC